MPSSRKFTRLLVAGAVLASASAVASAPQSAQPDDPGVEADPPPAVSASVVDNGDGTMTLTYANANPDEAQFVALFLLTAGSTCPPEVLAAPADPATQFVLTNSNGLALPPSPVVIGPGTPAYKFALPNPLPETTTIAPADYEACLYYPTGEDDTLLQQSLAVSLEKPTPPPAPEPPAPEPAPVHPAFTG